MISASAERHGVNQFVALRALCFICLIGFKLIDEQISGSSGLSIEIRPEDTVVRGGAWRQPVRAHQPTRDPDAGWAGFP